jgi:hypothetical protein
MNDIFEIFEPGQELVRNKYLEELHQNGIELILIISEIDSQKKLKITFANHFTYRSTNESYRLKSLYDRNFVNGINYSKNTKFIKWFKEETHGIYDGINFVHYLICTNDDITDIISADAPTFELL